MHPQKDIGFINEVLEYFDEVVSLGIKFQEKYNRACVLAKRLETLYYQNKEKPPLDTSVLIKPFEEFSTIVESLEKYKRKVQKLKKEVKSKPNERNGKRELNEARYRNKDKT